MYQRADADCSALDLVAPSVVAVPPGPAVSGSNVAAVGSVGVLATSQVQCTGVAQVYRQINKERARATRHNNNQHKIRGKLIIDIS